MFYFAIEGDGFRLFLNGDSSGMTSDSVSAMIFPLCAHRGNCTPAKRNRSTLRVQNFEIGLQLLTMKLKLGTTRSDVHVNKDALFWLQGY
jgi:hypothetical protein